jgi:O-antigen/teichoic acid export membrane protein
LISTENPSLASLCLLFSFQSSGITSGTWVPGLRVTIDPPTMTRSIFSNWFGLAALAVCTAILTPIMIAHLGAVDYGVWVLLGSVLDYYGLLDIGMRAAMFRYVGKFRGADARDEINRTFSSALLIVIITALLVGALSIVVAVALPHNLPLQGHSVAVYRQLLLLLGFSIAITFPVRMLATYLSAQQRWDLFNAASTLSIVMRGAAIIGALKLGYGIVAVAYCTLGVSLISLGQHIALVRLSDPGVRVSLSLISRERIGQLFGFSMRSLLVSIGDSLRFSSDAAVITAVMNIALVTPFSVATRLIECFKSVVIAAGGPVFGSMTQLEGRKSWDESRDLLLRSTRILGLLSVLGGVLLVVDGRALLQLWIGSELRQAYPVLIILALGYTINLASHPLLLIIIAKGKHGALGAWTIAEGLLNVGLSIIWGRKYGLIGIAMGTILPMLIVKLILQPYYALRASELSAWTYISQGLARPLLVAPLFALTAVSIVRYTSSGFAIFSATVLAQTAMFFGISWILGLNSCERAWIKMRLNRLLGLSIPGLSNQSIGSAKPIFVEKE